jgi:hypothetical protein
MLYVTKERVVQLTCVFVPLHVLAGDCEVKAFVENNKVLECNEKIFHLKI